MMSKRNLIILLVFLLIILSSINTSSALLRDGDNPPYEHDKYYVWRELNGTIMGKHRYYNGDFSYLVKINGKTFYLGSKYQPSQEFYLYDNVTMIGNNYYREGYEDQHISQRDFGGAYSGQFLPSMRLKQDSNGYGQMRLAEGFVRGDNSKSNQLSRSIPILKGTITNGNPKNDQTKCTIYVGKKHAGENVNIAVLYKKKGKNLNQGKIVPKTVSSDGKVSVKTANPLKKYPDKAIIVIYDSNKKISDAKVAILSKKSKAQHFKFNVGKSFTACKKYCPDISDEVIIHMMNECDSQGDSYLDKTEYNKFKSLVKFTRKYATNKKNHDKVDRLDLWTGDGTTKTRYCADHGRVKVGANNECPWCLKYGNDPKTKSDSTKYI